MLVCSLENILSHSLYMDFHYLQSKYQSLILECLSKNSETIQEWKKKKIKITPLTFPSNIKKNKPGIFSPFSSYKLAYVMFKKFSARLYIPWSHYLPFKRWAKTGQSSSEELLVTLTPLDFLYFERYSKYFTVSLIPALPFNRN